MCEDAGEWGVTFGWEKVGEMVVELGGGGGVRPASKRETAGAKRRGAKRLAKSLAKSFAPLGARERAYDRSFRSRSQIRFTTHSIG